MHWLVLCCGMTFVAYGLIVACSRGALVLSG